MPGGSARCNTPAKPAVSELVLARRTKRGTLPVCPHFGRAMGHCKTGNSGYTELVAIAIIARSQTTIDARPAEHIWGAKGMGFDVLGINIVKGNCPPHHSGKTLDDPPDCMF